MAKKKSRQETANLRLIDAALDNRLDEIDEALADGADINALNENGRSALHDAVFRGNTEAIEKLLALGADVNVRLQPNEKGGYDPKESAGVTPLVFAMDIDEDDPLSLLELLVAAGADVNARDDQGRTPLMWNATKSRRIDIAAALIAAGADLDAKDMAGNSVVAIARASNKGRDRLPPKLASLVAYLIEQGAVDAQPTENKKKPTRKAKEPDYRSLRGIDTFDVDQELIAVRGDVETVAATFVKASGAKVWTKNACNQSIAISRNCYAALRIVGHSWTLLVEYNRSPSAEPGAISKDLAKQLSAGAKALYYGNSDTASVTAYSLFDQGELVEEYISGFELQPDTAPPGAFVHREEELYFASTRRRPGAKTLKKVNIENDVVKELDLWIPCWQNRHASKSAPERFFEGFPAGAIERVDYISLVDPEVQKPSKEQARAELLAGINNNDLERMASGIAAGADVNEQQGTFDSLVARVYRLALFAVRDSQPPDTRRLQLLIQSGAEPTLLADINKQALTEAAHLGDLPLLRSVLNAGHDINVRGTIEVIENEPDGFRSRTVCRYVSATALSVAAGENKADVVRALIDAGATLDLCDDTGATALALAEDHGHDQVAEMLRSAGARREPSDLSRELALLIAAGQGNIDEVRRQIASGVDVETRDKRRFTKGQTALLLAATNDHADVVRLLLEVGANVHAKDEEGEEKNIEAKSLMHFGGPRDVIYRGLPLGRNAVLFAAEKGAARAIAVLAEYAPDLNLSSKYGELALPLATKNGHLAAVRALIAGGADINVRGSGKATSLHLAVDSGREEIAAALIDAGANLDLKNSDGLTPLMIAVTENRLDILKRLIAAGANLAIKDREKRTALDLSELSKVRKETREYVRKAYEN